MSDRYARYRRAWQRRWREAEERQQEHIRQMREVAHKCARLLVEQYGARRVYLFGSLVSSRQLHERSDIDLAVEGLGPGRVYWRALSQLWRLLPPGVELDLVPLEDAYPELAEYIRQEGELIYDQEKLRQLTSRH